MASHWIFRLGRRGRKTYQRASTFHSLDLKHGMGREGGKDRGGGSLCLNFSGFLIPQWLELAIGKTFSLGRKMARKFMPALLRFLMFPNTCICDLFHVYCEPSLFFIGSFNLPLHLSFMIFHSKRS